MTEELKIEETRSYMTDTEGEPVPEGETAEEETPEGEGEGGEEGGSEEE